MSFLPGTSADVSTQTTPGAARTLARARRGTRGGARQAARAGGGGRGGAAMAAKGEAGVVARAFFKADVEPGEEGGVVLVEALGEFEERKTAALGVFGDDPRLDEFARPPVLLPV